MMVVMAAQAATGFYLDPSITPGGFWGRGVVAVNWGHSHRQEVCAGTLESDSSEVV